MQYPMKINLGPAGIVTRCRRCDGLGHRPEPGQPMKACRPCRGSGYKGIDPTQPCYHPAGSIGRIAVMCCRAYCNLPIWNVFDTPEILTEEENRESP